MADFIDDVQQMIELKMAEIEANDDLLHNHVLDPGSWISSHVRQYRGDIRPLTALYHRCISILDENMYVAVTGSYSELPIDLILSERNSDIDVMLFLGSKVKVATQAREPYSSTGRRRGRQIGQSRNAKEMILNAVLRLVDQHAAPIRPCVELCYEVGPPIHAGYVRIRTSKPLETSDDRSVIDSHGPALRFRLESMNNVHVDPSQQIAKQIIAKCFNALRVSGFWRAMQTGLDSVFPHLDFVPCRQCPQWPVQASGFAKRRRRVSNWPPADLVQNVVSTGCHIVRVAHPDSKAPDEEYRFSFSAAETKLVRSWTTCQKYCYHLLRLLMKRNRVKGDDGLGILRTYHFKTLMLWSCERRPCSWWNWKDVIRCCTQLLVVMFHWLDKRRCPNYFIPANNMFDHVPPTTDVSREIQFLIDFADKERLLRFILDEEKLLSMDFSVPYFPTKTSTKSRNLQALQSVAGQFKSSVQSALLGEHTSEDRYSQQPLQLNSESIRGRKPTARDGWTCVYRRTEAE